MFPPRRVLCNRTIGLRRLVERRPPSRIDVALLGDGPLTVALSR
jgi:hypothetical protein